MTNPLSPERLRDHAIASLVPFFIDGSGTDDKAARMAAAALLDEYSAGTPRELQLSAQIIALCWASLACLRTAVAAQTLPVMERLGLQDTAIALDRSSQKATKALNARRKEREKNPRAMTAANTKWDEGVFQLAVNQALDALNDANTRLAAYMRAIAASAAPVAPPVVEAPEVPKLPILFPEQMTPSVLARRSRR
jgi:hypothetical protein